MLGKLEVVPVPEWLMIWQGQVLLVALAVPVAIWLIRRSRRS